jgi:carbamoyltransferase
MTLYIGLSTSGHDPSFAIVDAQGRVLFAEATERFLQDKRGWGAAPDHVHHLGGALAALGLDRSDERIVVATSWSHVKEGLELAVSDVLLPATDGQWIRGLQARSQTGAGASLPRLGLNNRTDPEIQRHDHHLCHAVTACHSAPFADGLCLVIDGEGEVGAASLYRLDNGWPRRVWRSWGPGSLGTYYAWLTNLCGFDWRAGEEWKVMGLAAFGTPDPELVDRLSAVMTIENGRIRLSDAALLAAAKDAAGIHARLASQPIMLAADLAASGQQAYARMADQVVAACLDDQPGNLILTGGCALNSAYNGTLARRFALRAVHVPSAPGDDGNALGAALLAWRRDHPDRPLPRGDGSPFLGTSPRPASIAAAAANVGPLHALQAGDAAAAMVADRLAAGRIIAVMRGAAEFGPRALGHRSILADPRPANMADRLNIQVKGREPYRPFAPVLPLDRVDQWFDHPQPSPYMSFTLPWKIGTRDRVPAVTHRDGTGRLQTVDTASNPWMDTLLRAFEQRTQLPIVLNTSFNVMGKPMVHTVEDALAVLMTTGLDGVLLDDVLIEKQPFTVADG